MSEERPYMMIYKDKWKALTNCMQLSERNRVMAAFFDYLTFGKEPKGLTKTGLGFFEFLRTSEENGKHRGAPFGNSNRRNKTKGIEKSNQDELKNQNKNQCSTDAKADAYTDAECNAEELKCAPTLDEVRKFAEESGLKNINPVRFFKYYQATGWMRKGDPIKDWRSLMETWTEPETPPEPERPYHPIEKLTECPMCYSTDVDQHGMDGRCNQCKAELVWSTWQGEWRPVVV